jgi:hypothetical protein
MQFSMTKQRLLQFAISGLALIGSAGAATITSAGSDLFNATNTYSITVNNGGNEQYASFGVTTPITNAGDSFLLGPYSTPVPDLASLNSALLTLSWSAAPTTVTGSASYTPTFNAATQTVTWVVVSAGAATATVNVTQPGPFTIDLLDYAGFDAALKADEAIEVDWTSSTTFLRTPGEKMAKNTSLKNTTLNYNLGTSVTANAGLVLDYQDAPVSGVPEPTTFGLIGLGLLGMRCIARKSAA